MSTVTQDKNATAEPATSKATWAKLAVGIAGASMSAILIRYARDAEPLAIAFWRCLGGAAALGPFAARRMGAMGKNAFALPAVAGLFLAVHFASWITSLELTTVAASVLLVSTTPVFTALAGRVVFGRRLPALAAAGMVGALSGMAVITGIDLAGGSLGGDALAVAGAATAAGYVMAGERARAGLGILEYATLTYGIAAACLLAACALGGVALWGFSAPTWLAIAVIVAGPQLLGHTMINLVLKDIDATTVSVIVMIEPVLTILLAFVLLGEVPGTLVYPGGALILGGIYLVSRARRTTAAAPVR